MRQKEGLALAKARHSEGGAVPTSVQPDQEEMHKLKSALERAQGSAEEKGRLALVASSKSQEAQAQVDRPEAERSPRCRAFYYQNMCLHKNN